MSSIMHKVINYLTGGPITVRDLVELEVLPTGQCAFPSHYKEMGWADWLPISCTTLLPFFSDGVAKGLDEDEICRFLAWKVKPDTFVLNDQEADTNEVTDLMEGEIRIKQRLALNGLSYPGCVEDVVKLYVEVGLSTKSIDSKSGKTTYDLVIRHLRHVDSVLILK